MIQGFELIHFYRTHSVGALPAPIPGTRNVICIHGSIKQECPPSPGSLWALAPFLLFFYFWILKKSFHSLFLTFGQFDSWSDGPRKLEIQLCVLPDRGQKGVELQQIKPCSSYSVYWESGGTDQHIIWGICGLLHPFQIFPVNYRASWRKPESELMRTQHWTWQEEFDRTVRDASWRGWTLERTGREESRGWLVRTL